MKIAVDDGKGEERKEAGSPLVAPPVVSAPLFLHFRLSAPFFMKETLRRREPRKFIFGHILQFKKCYENRLLSVAIVHVPS